MIALDDVVLRGDLDPRLGERHDDLTAQYADIFDALPPIEINQDNVLIDGWRRVRAAKRAERTEIAFVVVETDGDDDPRDRMYAANLRHGVQYSREQKRAYGITLHGRELSAKEIARLSGVGISTVYRWTRELRDQEKEERDSEIERLRDEGGAQQEIADELGMGRSTIAEIVGDSQVRISDKEPESQAESAIEAVEEETGEGPAEGHSDDPETESEPSSIESEMNVVSVAEQESAVLDVGTQEAPVDEEAGTSESEREPSAPEQILNTAREVLGAFAETRPDEYVARLEASASEWMTITDDSLTNELERELLTSAAAMCLWQEWMIWYQGGRTNAFADAFGEIWPVFVRGQAGQWRIVSMLRSMLRRFRS